MTQSTPPKKTSRSMVIAVVVIVVLAVALVAVLIIDRPQNTSNNTPSSSNTGTSNNNTPAPTVQPVSAKFSLLYTNGVAIPVQIADSSLAFYTVIPTFQFTYTPTSFNSQSFEIQNDGNVPIKVTSIILSENAPANSQVEIFGFGLYTSPSTIVGVGQSSTVNFSSTLAPVGTNAGASVAGYAGSTYSFRLEISAVQAS